MKTIQKLLEQQPVYLHDWSNKQDLVKDFRTEAINGYNILFASYSCANYSGDAFVLMEKDRALYEVNGNHCSCFGLEEQFEPERATLIDLRFRLDSGNFGVNSYCGNEFANELKTFLGTKNDIH